MNIANDLSKVQEPHFFLLLTLEKSELFMSGQAKCHNGFRLMHVSTISTHEKRSTRSTQSLYSACRLPSDGASE